MFESRESQTSDILDAMAIFLDLPAETRAAAEAEYRRLGEWLAQDNETQRLKASEVYPQGSLRLATVVAPIKRDGEFDFDIVYKRDLQKTSTTQAELKDNAVKQMHGYARHCKGQLDMDIEVEEKGRCIALNYPGRFHMDVLPAIPEAGGGSSTGLLISDTDIRLWLPTDPKGYAAWFDDRTRVGRKDLTFATREVVEVEPIAAPAAPSQLGRSVQLLKRHRDLWEWPVPGDKPISIIITTLAALAYTPAATLLDSLQGILRGMESGLNNRNEVCWIENPVLPRENFAEKWESCPARAEAFYAWLAAARRDLARVAGAGLSDFAAVVGPIFGDEAVGKALSRHATAVAAARQEGKLSIKGPTAGLAFGGGIAVPAHGFYGDVDPAS